MYVLGIGFSSVYNFLNIKINVLLLFYSPPDPLLPDPHPPIGGGEGSNREKG